VFNPKKKYLVARTVGGLGNRLAALLSCHALALDEDREFWVNWPLVRGGPHDRFPTAIDQLYRLNGVQPISVTRYFAAEGHPASLNFPLSSAHNQVRLGLSAPVLVFPIHGRLKIGEDGRWEAWRKLFWREYQLHPAIQEELQQFRQKHFDKMDEVIGLQVRAHGHQLARKWNAPKRFLEAVGGLIAKNPKQRFFLSSDDTKVTRAFLQAFGDRVVAQSKKNELNTDRALKQTIIDLHMLAICGKFLSTPHSGLPYFVSIMRGEGPVYPS